MNINTTAHTCLDHLNNSKKQYLNDYINIYNNTLNMIITHIIDNKLKYDQVLPLVYDNNIFNETHKLGFRKVIINEAISSIKRFRRSGKSFSQYYPISHRSSFTIDATLFKLEPSTTKLFDMCLTIQPPEINQPPITIPFFFNKQMKNIHNNYDFCGKIHVKRINNSYYLYFIYKKSIKKVKKASKEIGIGITHLSEITNNLRSDNLLHLYKKLSKHTNTLVRKKITQNIHKEEKVIINTRINKFISNHQGYHIREQSINLSTLKMILAEPSMQYQLKRCHYSYFINTLIRKLKGARCSFDLPVFDESSGMCSHTNQSGQYR